MSHARTQDRRYTGNDQGSQFAASNPAAIAPTPEQEPAAVPNPAWKWWVPFSLVMLLI